MFVSRQVSLIAVAVAGLAGATVPAMAATQTAVFDLDDIVYEPFVPNVFGSIDTGLAGNKILEFGWIDAVVEVFDNTGTSNFASQAYLGFSHADGGGGTTFTFDNPGIADTSGPGVFGPYSGSINLRGVDILIADDGLLQVAAISSWDDGSGDPSGMWTSGQFYVTYEDVPAPGALALLGVTAIFGRRRRS